MNDRSHLPPVVENTALRRALGPQIAMAVVVGSVIGSGIFLKPGNIAGASGRFDLIISVWIFGGLLCVLGALCFAELATMLPRAGGLYVYLREAYGRPTAFLYGWTEVIFGKPASTGALAMAFVGSLRLAAGWAPSMWFEVALATLLVVALAWVNILGVLWGGRMQWLTTVVKVAFLALVGLLPFLLLPFIPEAVDASNYGSTVVPQHETLAAQVGAVLLAVLWAYNGWHGITQLAEEVKQPQRNIPLALIGGMGVLIVLYVGANLAYHGAMSMEEMRGAGDHAAEEMLRKLLGQPGLSAMAAVIMCSTLGAINSNLLQTPRISFAMGRDRVFAPLLGKIHVNYRTPAPAIAVMALMAVLLILAVALAKAGVAQRPAEHFRWELARRIVRSLQDGTIFSLLTNFVIFSASIFYLLGVLAVIVLRRRRPDAVRPYRTWGYPVTPLLFSAVYIWFLYQVYQSNPLESRTGLVLIAAGLPVYLYYWAKARGGGPHTPHRGSKQGMDHLV